MNLVIIQVSNLKSQRYMTRRTSSDQEKDTNDQNEQILNADTASEHSKSENSESSISLSCQLCHTSFTSKENLNNHNCKKQKKSVGRRSSDHKRHSSTMKPCEGIPPVINESTNNDDVNNKSIEETFIGKLFFVGQRF